MHEPPTKPNDALNGAGDDDSPVRDATPDDDLSRFADAFQSGLPRLSDEAMGRVAQTMRDELHRVYPHGDAAVWTWRGLSGVAAALALLVGLVWYIVATTPPSGPATPSRQANVQPVVDEFDIVIDPALPDTAPDASAPPRQQTLMPVAEYDALVGNDRLSQR